MPAVALGINDLIGTGVYSGEYLVASKRFGNFDFSLGIGWGRLASTNSFKKSSCLNLPFFRETQGRLHRWWHQHFEQPFPSRTDLERFWGRHVANSHKKPFLHSGVQQRHLCAGNQGGELPSSQPNELWGYHTASRTVLALSLDWLYGRGIGGNISFDMDPTTDSYPQRIGPAPPPPPPIRSAKQQQEAIDLMLGRRDTSMLASPEKFASSGKLVDALWRESGEFTDVAVRGRRLALTLERGNLGDICRAAARTVALYNVTITTVSISSGSNRLSCPVSTSPAVALPAPSIGSGPNAMTFSPPIIPAAFITIDAAIEPEPDVKAAIFRIHARPQPNSASPLMRSASSEQSLLFITAI